MITVATVYRSGGDFTAADVGALCRAVRVHLPVAHRFVCLTDQPKEVEALGLQIEAIPLKYNWPGWWAKFEMYGLPWDGLVIYWDLDSVPCDDMTPFTEYTGERAIIRDFFRDDMVQTCMWIWRGNALRPVWDALMENADAYIADYTRRRRRSDHFTRMFCEPADRIQDLWPGAAVSFKVHCLGKPRITEISQYRTLPGKIPAGARVVCFHGYPRPRDLPADHWFWQNRGVQLARAA